MNIIVFGIGYNFEKYKNHLPKTDKIIAFIDNDEKSWGQSINGIQVQKPQIIKALSYDYAVIMSTKYAYEMKAQLMDLSVPEERIISFNKYYGMISKRIIHDETVLDINKKNILIITYWMNYNGGSNAVIYAARALINMGYSVTIFIPGGNTDMINLLRKKGIRIEIASAIFSLDECDIQFFKLFDLVFINTFELNDCIGKLAGYVPVIWWLHEPEFMIKTFSVDINSKSRIKCWDKVNIYAVSRNAQRAFNKFYNAKTKIMPYGIPDVFVKTKKMKDKEQITIAIIGTVSYNKAQDIFVQAAEIYNESCCIPAEFWIIGRCIESDYCKKIENSSKKIDNLIIKGELNREKMEAAYADIDVLVCASRQETMSITVTEAMMHQKICITTQNAGISDYINNGINGYIYKQDNPVDLYELMRYVAENFEQLNEVGRNARKTYLDNFTMEKFSDRLADIVSKNYQDNDHNF